MSATYLSNAFMIHHYMLHHTNRLSWVGAGGGLVRLTLLICFAGPLQLAAEDAIPSPSDMRIESAGPQAAADGGHQLAAASFSAATRSPRGVCDPERQADLAEAVDSAFAGVFFDNDFSYLDDPCYHGTLFGERLKRVDTAWGTFDFGGEARIRYMDEHGFSSPGLGLTGNDSTFWLHRTRLFANWEVNDALRLYTEGIHADQGNIVSAAAYNGNNGHVPRGNEINRTEVLNLFADVTLLEDCDQRLFLRGGRQELPYGSQRILAAPNWANTRLSFDAATLAYRRGELAVDGLWARPLVRDIDDWDAPDDEIQLYGVYSSRDNTSVGTFDLYWLALDDDQVGFRYDTLGTRLAGEADDWIWDMEFGIQFGDNSDDTTHDAQMATVGIGRNVEWCFLGESYATELMCYYDYASGGATAGNGWHPYFPKGHKYLGFMDLFGRRNLHDWNVKAETPLTDRVSLLLWYHHFELDRSTTPFNVNLTPFSGAPAGDDTLGDEIDLLLSVTLGPRTIMFFGLSHFAAGDYYSTTAGVPSRDDANFFYWQARQRF